MRRNKASHLFVVFLINEHELRVEDLRKLSIYFKIIALHRSEI